MDVQLIFGFIGASVLLAIMPGPDIVYVLTESVAKGWRQGLGITAGLMSGIIVHTTLVATGVSLIVFTHPVAFQIVKYAGAVYLIWLAYNASMEQPMAIELDAPKKRDHFAPLFRQGFLMNVLNPKVSIFFIALLPQFVTPDGWPAFVQLILLGGLFVLSSFPVFGGVALAAGKLSEWLGNPRFWKVMKWLKVMVLLVLAIGLTLAEA